MALSLLDYVGDSNVKEEISTLLGLTEDDILRSKDIYGPYEEKIVMAQNDSPTNGPHQGALVDLKDGRDVFIHFQDLRAYGRIVHLQPVTWHNNWPIIGRANDLLLNGSPVIENDYFIENKSNYKLESSDSFKNKLSLMWQTPANINKEFYSFNNGLELKCLYHDESSYKALNKYPYTLLAKLCYKSFKIKTELELNLKNNGDIAGLVLMGQEYHYICIEIVNNDKHIRIKKGSFNNELDEIIYDEIINDNNIIFNLKYDYPNTYMLGFNNKYIKQKFIAYPGRWIGAKYGIFAEGKVNGGSAVFKYFKVTEVRIDEGK